MLSRLNLRLQTLILAVLFPALLVATIGAGWLVYQNLRGIILTGFDQKLTAVSTVTGAFIDGDEHARILRTGSEDTPEYRRYVEPMREIMARQNLTYLYSQVARGRDSIQYVLDATRGEGHSPIGSMDHLPAETVAGAHQVLSRGDAFVSGIQRWELWGLIKTGFAPIRDGSGGVVAMAGADVDISIIRDKTRVALAQVGLAAIVALLLGALVSLFVSRRLVSPLSQVREGALLIAAGDYSHRIELRHLRELEQLSRAFNSMSGSLATTFRELTEANRALETCRRNAELLEALARPPGGKEGESPVEGVRVEWLNGQPLCRDPSGYLPAPDGRVLVWLEAPAADTLDALVRRRQVEVVARRLLDAHGDDWEALAPRLETAFPGVHAFVLLDPERARARSAAREPVTTLLVREDGRTHPADLSERPTIQLRAGESLILSSIDPAAAIAHASAGGADAPAGLLVVLVPAASPRGSRPPAGAAALSPIG